MKGILSVCFLFASLFVLAQVDSVRAVEPNRETSFDNYELLILAIAGLLILMGIRFWFKRTRKR